MNWQLNVQHANNRISNPYQAIAIDGTTATGTNLVGKIRLTMRLAAYSSGPIRLTRLHQTPFT